MTEPSTRLYASRFDRIDARLPIAFLVLALLFGGAGISYPLAQVALELAAIALLWRTSKAARFHDAWPMRGILLLFLAAFLLLAVQLVPLPPTLWRALPDRTTATTLYDALGWSARWHAASLTPDVTFEDMFALLPPLAAFVMTAGSSERRRLQLKRVIVAAALVSTVLAALQVAAGADNAPILFETIHRGYGVGFFVNRNHQATFLLVAILLAATPGVVTIRRASLDPRYQRLTVLAVIAFLSLGVIATTSRMGLVLLPLALIAVVAVMLPPGRVLAYVAGCAALYGVAAAVLYPTPLVQQTMQRFASASEDQRYEYWDNTRFAIGQSMPWGTGFGSFDPIYRSVEPLAQVTPLRVNHAHNDFLEVALEGGAPAILLMAVGIAVVLFLFGLAWRRSTSRNERSGILAAAVGTVLILLCSLVDYPLRMSAIAVLLGTLLGSVVLPTRRREDGEAIASNTLIRRRAIGLVAMLAALFALAGGAATWLTMNGNSDIAVRLAPWSSAAWSSTADTQLARQQYAASAYSASRALAIAPLDATAVRVLAYADIATGQPARGAALLQLGAALGWRETATQFWLVQEALAQGNLEIGVERIEGLLRRNVAIDPLMQELRAIFLYPGGGAVIADRLAERPPWRAGFFNTIADDSPRAVPQIFDLLQVLRSKGAPVDETETGLIRWRLSDAGNYAAARGIWLASGGSGLLGDGEFASGANVVPAGSPPFAWQAPSGAGVHVSIDDSDGQTHGRSVVVASDGFATGPALAQTIVLPAGAYRLGMSLLAVAWTGSPPMSWSLSCRQAGAAVGPVLVPMSWPINVQAPVRATETFTIPEGCLGWTLALSLHESGGQPYSFRLDHVTLTREPAAIR